MPQRTKLISDKGLQLEYEFRFDRAFVAFVNFTDARLNTFADMLTQGTYQIESVDRLTRYDEQCGSIIAVMELGYSEVKAHEEIKEVFDCFSLAYPTK